MITLAVCGVADVPRFAQSNLTDIVSFGDPGTHPDLCKPQPPPDFSVFPGVIVHRFEFQDICHVSETSPSTLHVKTLLDLFDFFLAEKDEVRVLFHCQAGIARSTAAAFILCVRAGMTYQEAYNHVLKVRGLLVPNLLMIKHADDLMGQEGRMLNFIARERDKLSLSGDEDGSEWVRNRGWEVKS